jgi:predicted Zn finger-like uncharacterized protein
MLIACPNCTTSYMIDPAALGPAGRTVRCARCKATWFAGASQSQTELKAYVDGVIMESEARTSASEPEPPPVPAASEPDAAVDDSGIHIIVSASPPLPQEAPENENGYDASMAEAEPALVDSPPMVPAAEHEPLPEPGDAEIDSEDIESFAARRERLHARRKQARRSSRWTAIVLVLFAVNVALVGARDEVVRYLPQTASLFAAIGLPVNLRDLKFENVKITKEKQDGNTVLIVHGSIVSTADKPITVPRLRFAARNATGQEIYTWTALPSRSILGPGERLDFRSRLASPPADASSIMVRFFKTQDADAGEK